MGKDGFSTMTRSPGSSSAPKVNESACSAPLVTTTRAGSADSRWPIHSRSSGMPSGTEYCRAVRDACRVGQRVAERVGQCVDRQCLRRRYAAGQRNAARGRRMDREPGGQPVAAGPQLPATGMTPRCGREVLRREQWRAPEGAEWRRVSVMTAAMSFGWMRWGSVRRRRPRPKAPVIASDGRRGEWSQVQPHKAGAGSRSAADQARRQLCTGSAATTTATLTRESGRCCRSEIPRRAVPTHQVRPTLG